MSSSIPPSPSFDAFLQIDGIPGESTDGQHQDWIEILSFNWGINQTANSPNAAASSTGASAGRANFREFTITKTVDKASPNLMQACSTGQHIKTAVLSVRGTGTNQDYLKVSLTSVLVSSFVQGGHAQNATEPTPSEQVRFDFTKVELSFTGQNADGTIETPVIGDGTVG